MAHTHDVYDTGKHFEINGISRFIKETSTTKLVLVQGDHKSEVVTFKMPRYIDGHDMLLCDKIRVHYINIETQTSNSSADIYEVTDLKLCEDCEEEEILLFTWTIEAPATKYFGSLSFLVKFECTEGDNILYQWNTAKYVNINVLNGIDNSEAFVAKYSNVLEEWYNKLMGESETVANLVEQLEDCEKVTASATSATSSCVEATENCISATEEAESVRAEIEAGGFIESLKEQNNGGKFSVWVGTKGQYDALPEIKNNCLYICTDEKNGAMLLDLGDRDLTGQTILNIEKYTLVKVVLPDEATILCNVKIDNYTFSIDGISSDARILPTSKKALIDNYTISIKGIINDMNGSVTDWAFINWIVQEKTDANGIPTIEHLDCALCKIIGIM